MLRAHRMGIDTYQEAVLYLRRDSPVCQSEGFAAQSRIEVWRGEVRIIATLNVVEAPLLEEDQAGLSEAAWRALGVAENTPLALQHLSPIQSFSHVRQKLFGAALSDAQMQEVICDVAAGNYSDLEVACFVAAVAGQRASVEETTALTRAMVAVGRRLTWPSTPIVDKHCVGGLPGNRTTLIVTPILAACGLTIPKTSSRAITSPAGTADTMETLAPVALDIEQMRKVVEKEGGCVIWGGAVSLSPADDILIRVERPLGLDSDSQLVASVLSKKIAAGSTHVLIDIPLGPSAKVRSQRAADHLSHMLCSVGQALGLHMRTVISDGASPVGIGIGPALEAHDVLAVLQNAQHAPQDLRMRALTLAAHLLEMGGKAAPGAGLALARSCLESGQAWRKFVAICEAQGGMRTPPRAPFVATLHAQQRGRVRVVNNLELARLAKLAGAPQAPAAGLRFLTALGAQLEEGQPWLEIHAQTQGQLDYAMTYARTRQEFLTLEDCDV
ncbi:thymidine phosphorylase family protein [Massilia sp. W12]|uniref:thymidine phosphorylase family protein n=1 Tax=Massilia sp. W12 TaxID=3126507 RepID=UPI0030D2833F